MRAGALAASLGRRLCCCGRASGAVGARTGGQWIPPGGAPAPAGDMEAGGSSSGFLYSRGGAGHRPQREQPRTQSFNMFQGSGQRLGSA
mmetsp:Transcript_76872/g.197965  ORF Transcript_76872/g.197965 Transcript_76872/m.197965 type:complete len:89 (-) Transcript_76872:82-348(-)